MSRYNSGIWRRMERIRDKEYRIAFGNKEGHMNFKRDSSINPEDQAKLRIVWLKLATGGGDEKQGNM